MRRDKDLTRKEQEEVINIYKKYREPRKIDKKHLDYLYEKLNYFHRACFKVVFNLIRMSRSFKDPIFNSYIKDMVMLTKGFLLESRKRSIFSKNDLKELEELRLAVQFQINSIKKSEAMKRKNRRKDKNV